QICTHESRVTCNHVSFPSPFSSSSFFLFPGGELPRLFCILALYGTYRVHDKGMKSPGAKGAYCHERWFTVGLLIFPVRVRGYSSGYLLRVSWT
ncbi:hypothetical protein K443DRAFT_401868, partial [Laccaria amethystina LaAM-08-1]